jgi:hypothetical protein
MAVIDLDGTTQAVSGTTYSQSSVGTDGVQFTGPAGATAIYAYASAAATFEVAGGAPVPLDATTWTLVWERGQSLPSSPEVLVKASTGTITVYLRVT